VQSPARAAAQPPAADAAPRSIPPSSAAAATGERWLARSTQLAPPARSAAVPKHSPASSTRAVARRPKATSTSTRRSIARLGCGSSLGVTSTPSRKRRGWPGVTDGGVGFVRGPAQSPAGAQRSVRSAGESTAPVPVTIQ
jgi:hypothetical protein